MPDFRICLKSGGKIAIMWNAPASSASSPGLFYQFQASGKPDSVSLTR
jgi:hypothetical protein